LGEALEWHGALSLDLIVATPLAVVRRSAVENYALTAEAWLAINQ